MGREAKGSKKKVISKQEPVITKRRSRNVFDRRAVEERGVVWVVTWLMTHEYKMENINVKIS